MTWFFQVAGFFIWPGEIMEIDAIEIVSESIAAGSKVENGVVRNVKILGKLSKNRRSTYPVEVMREAVNLYEGAKSDIDHLRDPAQGTSFFKRFGVIRNPRVVNEEIRADYHFNPKHPAAEQFVWAVENQPQSIGFSHVAHVRWKNTKDGRVAEKIEAVRSVDLVADPATTGGVFEDVDPAEHSREDKMSTDLSGLTLEQLRATRPELVEAITAEAAKAGDMAAVTRERDELKAKVATMEAEEKKRQKSAELDDLLTEAGLDPKNPRHVGKLFRRVLESANDSKELAEMIQERHKELDEAGLLTAEGEGETSAAEPVREAREFFRNQAPTSRAPSSNSTPYKHADGSSFAKSLRTNV